MTLVSRTLFALAAFWTLAPLAHAQSLADVARQTEEERTKTQEQSKSDDNKKAEAPKSKVYTNKELTADNRSLPETKTDSTEEKTPGTNTKAASTKEDKAAEGKSKDAKKDEAYWRGRVAPLHRTVAEKLAKAATVDRRIRELTDELSGIGPLNARRGGVESERQRLITEADTLRASISVDKAEIEAIEEEGRRAGALPGWFR
jgi:hypothetical protein